MRGTLYSTPSPEQRDRYCATCDCILPIDSKGIQSGYYCCDEYFCDRDCLDQSFDGDTWEKHYTEDGDCYWTEWENETAMTCPIDPQEALNCEGCQ